MSRMSQLDRAKQFAPFSALKGFEDAIKLRERERFHEVILAEDAQAELNLTLMQIERGDTVTAVYYCNSEYLTVTGTVTKIDITQRRIQIDETRIPIDKLLEISI